MKKRTKKYNPKKQLNMVARVALRDFAIGYVTGLNGCHLLNVKKSRLAIPSNTTIRLVESLRHQWSIFIAVLGVDSQGKQYMKAEEVSVEEPVFQHELVETLNLRHKKMVDGFNMKHFTQCAWLATPYDKVWEEEEAFKLISITASAGSKSNAETI